MANTIRIGTFEVSNFKVGLEDPKIYLGDILLYPTGGYKVCYAVVDDISQYSETEFEDVYDKATEKWYKLNNLNQYEEYGIYGDSIATSGSSRLPQGYTEVEYVQNNTQGAYINTGLLLYDVTGNSFSISAKLKSQYESTWAGDGYYLQTIINSEDVSSPYYGFTFRYAYQTHILECTSSPSNSVTFSSTANTDGTSSLTINCNSTTVTAQVPLELFASYNGNYNTPYRFSNTTIYSFQVTKNNTLVRDLVPCKRDSDNMVGLYDIVNDVFYYPPNYTSYQLVAGSAVTPTAATYYQGKLAIVDGYEYQYSGGSWVNVGEVSGSSITIKSPEYIAKTSSYSSGQLNLGYTLKDNTKFQIKIRPTANGGGACLGELNAPSDRDDYRIFWYSNSLYYDYGSDRTYINQSINNTYEYEVGNYYVKNLATSATVITGTTKSGIATSHTRNIYAFIGGSDYCEIYYLKIYEGDTLVKDFIPWTDMNGNYGFFDKVSLTYIQSTNQLTASTTINDVEVGGGYDYPIYYSEKSEPLDNLTFNTLEDAQAYAKANCVYDGMHATIGADRYYFDSSDENGWVKILEYYKFEDVTPGGASGWTISGSDTYNPDSSYYDDFDLETTSTSNSYKIAKVTIYGYDHFTYYLRSYHQYSSSYGYVMATNVDEIQTPPSTMSYNSSSAITSTYNWSNSPKSAVNLSKYRRITYNNLDKTVEHTFYVYFYGRTYISRYVGNATILIPKEQTNENWEQVTFSASSNVASSQKSLYIDGNYSTSGGTQYWYYRWMVGLPSGSHSSYTYYSNYSYCPNVTSSTFTSVAGEQRQVNFTYNETTNKTLSFRLTDGNGNVLTPSDTVYYNMTYYNSCGVSISESNVAFPMSHSVKVGGRFRFKSSSNRQYIYGYSPSISLNYDYYVNNYQSTFDITYTKLSEEAVTITYTTYDPSDVETPAFKTDITWPYSGGTTSSTTLTSYSVPYSYPYEVSQTSNKFSADSQSYTAGQAARTINFVLYPNNREFATVADLEAYQYAWEGMKAKVGDTNYEYKNGEWVEKASKDSDFVIGDFNTFISSSTEVTEGYYIIYYYGYNSNYANKSNLFSWNSGNTWNGYYTLGNMNHNESNTSVPISSSEIIDDAVWELKDAGNGNFYIRNVGTNKYWYWLGTNTSYGVPLSDNASDAIPVNIQDWRSCLAFVEKQSSHNNVPLNRLYNYSYRYGWYGSLATDGNNQYYMRKYVP